MKPSSFVTLMIVLLAVLFPFLVFFTGYAIVIVCTVAFLGMLASFAFCSNEIKEILSTRVNRYSLFFLLLILVFFVSFSLFFLPKTQLIFFDENIYVSNAMGILNSGSGLLCWYGTAYLEHCYLPQIGFDPGGWPFILAVASLAFGANASTAYGVELFLGAFSVVLVFLISSLLTTRKEIGVLSAAIFSLIPMVFVWSRTEANPSLPFMAFAMLALLAFLFFAKRPDRKTLSLLTFVLILTVYMRIEAVLLVPIFIISFLVFGEKEVRKTIKEKVRLLERTMEKLPQKGHLLLLLAVFIIFIEPEIYVMVASAPALHANAVFYLGPSITDFSLNNFFNNIGINLSYLAGQITVYPIIFLPNITALAILGAAFLLLCRRYENRMAILTLLGLVFLGYFLFYDFYWAGSVLSGTSVRFMLMLCPPLAIFSAFGIAGLSDFLMKYIYANGKTRASKTIELYSICLVLAIILFVLPFCFSVPFLTHPNYNYEGYPTINATPAISNRYQMIYPNRSLAFIYENYKLVPSNCLVFSEAPYLWYGMNRSSAIPDIADQPYPGLGNYSCYAFDYDWWCTIRPYNTTICQSFLDRYKLKVLATESSGIGSNFSIYQILNYTNP